MQPTHHRQKACALLAATLLLALGTTRTTATPETDTLTDEGNLITTITAKVEALDTTKRQITLRGPLDNVVTLSVGKDVKRLDEIKVGDYITADYYISLALDLSMPDPDDMDHPITVTDMTQKAPSDAPPGAAEFSVIRVIATVEGMDAPTQTLALRGPAGRHFLVAVKDVNDLKGLRLDDKVSVLCTQAVVVTLDKASPADADKVKRSAANKSMTKKKMPQNSTITAPPQQPTPTETNTP